MGMDHKSKSDAPAPGSERSFGLVFSTVFLVIGLWPLWHGAPVRLWALTIAIVFAVIAVVYPTVLKQPNIAWFRFGMWISRFTTPIIMALIFVVAVVPTGFVLRLFGKDPMRRKIDRASSTYWLKREEQPGPMTEQY